MVATDIISDAELVHRLLRNEFKNIHISTDPSRSVSDFENRHPDILILAFNSLEKAEAYYLGIYRLSDKVHAIPHRSIILCNKDDLKRVYDLCKREYFDDYVLFWPVPHDALRLPMTVHHALRQMHNDTTPLTGEIATAARRLFELEELMERHSSAGGQRVDDTARSLQQAETDILNALDKFYSRLTAGGLRDLVEIRDSTGFQQEFNQLRREGIKKPFQYVDDAVKPMRQWTGTLQSDLALQIESTRALHNLAMQIRPTVLIVDDDEFQHKLLSQILEDENLELVFATSGSEALGSLRRRKPDLILMDIRLPGDDGVEVTRKIKSVERFTDIPVIMITGKGEKNIVLDSVRAGAADFIVKPFNKTTLVKKINNILMECPASTCQDRTLQNSVIYQHKVTGDHHQPRSKADEE